MPPKKKKRKTLTAESTATKIITRKGLRSSETSTSSTASPSLSSTLTTGDTDTRDTGTAWTRQAPTATTNTQTPAVTTHTTDVRSVTKPSSSNTKEPLINADLLKPKAGELEHAFVEAGPALEQLRQEREAQLKEFLPGTELMLLIGRNFSDTGTATSSESANPESHTVAIETKNNREKKEANLPEDKSSWMVQQGEEATLIYNDRNHILNEACRRGSLEIVKELLASGADINNRSIDGLTPVMIAAWTGNKQLFDLLVKLKCDLFLMLENGNNILHVASFGRNRDIIDFIISNKIAGIESKGKHGRTALMKAAMLGERQILDLLVSNGSDLSVVDDYGNNILHLACYGEDTEIVLYLINQNIADIDSRGEYGRTPVMLAARIGNKKVFDLLVGRGCDLSVVDDDGINVLHIACFSDNVEIVQHVVSKQIAGIDSRGQFGRTPVMFAVEFGQKNVLEFLVSKGCDLSLEDEDGNNVLHLACKSDNVEIVQYLISQEIADIDSEGEYQRTPVIVAAMEGHKNVFNLLVSKGCDLSVVDGEENNLLYLACYSDCVEIVEYLIQQNIGGLECKCLHGRTPVMLAAERGQGKVFHLLVGKGSELFGEDDFGNTILHLACFSDNVEIVQYLISHQIAGLDRRNDYGKTAVMFAALKGQKKVFDFLMSKRCDLCLVDYEGNNILHCAAIGGNISIIENILSTEIIDINCRNHQGRLASETAQLFKHKKAADLLLARRLAEQLDGVSDEWVPTTKHKVYLPSSFIDRLKCGLALKVRIATFIVKTYHVPNCFSELLKRSSFKQVAIS